MKKNGLILMAAILLIFIAACTHQNGGSQTVNTPDNSGGSKQDAAYNLDDLIAAVRKAGLISGEPESLDVKENGAERVVSYGNIVFLAFDPGTSNAYFDAYVAEEVVINGKKVKVGAINGPYMMAFMDGNVDQAAVKAFRSIGY